MKKSLRNQRKALQFFSILCVMLISTLSWGQTTVFNDAFTGNQSASNVASYVTAGASSGTVTGAINYTAYESGTFFSSATGVTVKELNNVASSGIRSVSTISGPLSALGSPFNTTLNANPGIVTWTFNMKNDKSSAQNTLATAFNVGAGGSTGGAACTGVVLVTNNAANSNISAAPILTKGWAVVMTQGVATTQNRLDLGYFDAGLTSAGFHSILNTGDLAFNATSGTIKFYYSVRVTYNPATNAWAMSYRADAGSGTAVDPSTTTGTWVNAGLTSGITTNINTNATTTAMTNFMFYYNHSGTNTAGWDNFKIVVDPPSTTPLIVSAQSSLSGFAYVQGNGPSSVQSTVISGTNLGAGASIIASLPTYYEISKDNFVTAAATAALDLGSGATLSVRLKAGLTSGTYPENIVLSSTGATNVSIPCSGSVTASEPTAQVTNLTFTNNLATSFTINWTNTSSGGGTNHLVVIKAATDITSNPTDATTYTAASGAFTTGTALGGGYVVYKGIENTVNVTGLSKGIRYHVRVYDFNGSAGTENYLVTAPTSSYQTTEPGEITSNGTGGGDWTAVGTWIGGIPTQGDNVTILAGDEINVNTTGKCYNLAIPATSKVWATSGKTLQVYGTSLACEGTFGDASNTASILSIEFGENLTISGSGGIYPAKLKPITGITNIGVTFNANVSLTATGTTLMFDNGGNDNMYYTVNSPRTLNIAGNFNTCSSSATQSSSNNTLTINSGAIVNLTGVLNTNEASSKTYTANINGTLAVTGTSTLSGTSGGGVATFNVNGNYTSGTSISTGNLLVTPIEAAVAPVINVGSSGVITVVNGTADFSNTSLTGYIGNAPSTTGGTFILGALGTIKFANASGLETSAGPIRTSTRTFNTGANYNFVGATAQVPGSDFPPTVGNMTINNANGVTLSSSKTVSTNLNLTSGGLTTGGYLTLANGATIIRSAGSLSAAPTFGSKVNVTYNGATAISSGLEIPNATTLSSVLNNLTIATTGSAVVTLASATNLNNKLSVTSGSLNSDGFLTLKSAECCTAFVGVLAAGAVTGDVTVERYIPAKRAWRAITAPVIRATNNSIFTNWQNGGISGTSTGTGVEIWSNLSPLTTVTSNAGGGSSMLSYSSSGNSWSGITDTTNTPLFSSTLNNPFMVFVTGPYASTSTNITSGYVATTLKATGSLIIGTKTYATTGSQYTFIGNPYASPLSLTAMLTDPLNSTNFTNGIWIWDSNGNTSVGSYNYFDKTAGTYSYNASSTPAATPILPTAEIQSGQAFFVQQSNSTATGVSFSITEDHKGISVINTVLRDAAPAQLLRVGLYKQSNTEWSGRDGAMTVILNDADANQMANKMANGTENVAFTKNGLLFASEHHLPLVASDVLNVKVWNTTAGANYKLKINTEQFATTILNATLEDLFTNSRTPLTLDGSAVEYPFAVTTEALSTGNRFRIVFENSALGINNPKATGISILPNPITGDTFQVNFGTLGMGSYSYSICNALGQEVEKGSINNVAQNTNSVVKFKNNTAAGLYIMKVTGTDNTVFTAKIIKK